MGNVVRHANHDVAMEGKDLAVVQRYARLSPVVLIRIRRSVETHGVSIVEFVYDDGANCVTRWADWRVALRWIRARRTWSCIDRITVHDGMYDAMEREMPATLVAIRQRGTRVLEIS